MHFSEFMPFFFSARKRKQNEKENTRSPPFSFDTITLDLFQNCYVPEEVSGTFDPEVDLNDDAVGRCCYVRFYSVRSPIMRHNI